MPREGGGQTLRHALEVRHASFADAGFAALAKKYGAAIVLADSSKYPAIPAVTADFVYARLMRAEAKVPTGYAPAALKQWLARAQTWAAGGAPADLPLIGKAPTKKKRDVFVYFINGAKERAPAAAQALLKMMDQSAG